MPLGFLLVAKWKIETGKYQNRFKKERNVRFFGLTFPMVLLLGAKNKLADQ